jgi:hypothetical protein
MPIKLLISMALMGLLWWFVGREQTPVVKPANNNNLSGLQTTADRVKNLPSTVAISPNSSVPAVSPLPQVSSNSRTPSSSATALVLQPRNLALDNVTEQILKGLMAVIITQESSGNYQLVHPVSKAIGLGQVLPSNVPEWTKEAFGQELSVEQFRSNPDVQFYTIRHKLYQYYRRAIEASAGDLYVAVRRVSAQWYSGQADLFDSTKPVATGPNIRDYTLQVLGRFQNFYPQNYIVRYN